MPECGSVRIAVDVTLAIFVVLPSLIIYAGKITPMQRGFFCSDESIRYPYYEKDTIRSSTVAVVSLFSNLIVMIGSEVVHYKAAQAGADPIESKRVCCCRVNPCVYTLLGYYWILNFGALITQAITDIGKYSLGRLRPNFMAACYPDAGLTHCITGQYISNFTCLQPDQSVVNFVRTSFPSGHASQSAYTMVFLVCYIQQRVPRLTYSYLFKHVLQFAAICFAWITGLSRVMDYKHHSTDVLAGYVIGTLVALLCVRYAAKSFRDPYTNPSYKYTSLQCGGRQQPRSEGFGLRAANDIR